MTRAQRAAADAAENRRNQDLEKAAARLRQEQDSRTYGVVSFHLQAGRIVRVEVLVSEKIGD